MAEKTTIWAFDLGKGSIGEAVRLNDKFLHKASHLNLTKEKGLKLSLAPVQELRFYWLACSQADSLKYQPPQVLIS